MIFQKFKEDVVVEKGWATIKEIKNMACRLGLLTIFLALGLGLITYSTVGFPVTLIVLILLGMGYVWMFDMADETEEMFKLVMKISKLWWISLIIDVIIFLLLKYFRFI